jgi:hypothetical protein
MATISTRPLLPLREWGKRGGADVSVRPQWHRSAPSVVASADGWDVGSEGWTSWSAHLADRRRPRPLVAILYGKRPSLAWAIQSAAMATLAGRLPAPVDLISWLDRIERHKSWNAAGGLVKVATDWTNEATHRRRAAFGLECIAWSRALPALTAFLPADLWWALFELLLCFAEDAATMADGDVLSGQWLGAELPLVLAYLFPEIAPARSLARQGGRALSAGLDSLVTASGMPSAANLSIALPLLATWARSRAIAQRLKKSRLPEDAESRYRAFVRQVLHLCRRDGTLALSVPGVRAADRDMFAAALAGAPREDRALARLLIPGYIGPKVDKKRLPPAAANDESAGVSMLRPSWARGREQILVARTGSDLLTELVCGRDVLWSGKWSCEVRRNGAALAPETGAKWEETCWTTNEDADYVEFELALSGGVRVERQVLLARKDRFLFLADAVLGDEPASLEYRSALPLRADIAFDASTESREGYVVGSKARALAFPLRLPEWRAEPCVGALEFVDAGLELRASGSGKRLYAPLFFDLNPGRLFRPATWRQLTIAESRQIVPADQAVSYRVQVRNEQWLIYRSLGERGNRTVLGQNLVSEFLVARFNRKGEIAPLLEIE